MLAAAMGSQTKVCVGWEVENKRPDRPWITQHSSSSNDRIPNTPTSSKDLLPAQGEKLGTSQRGSDFRWVIFSQPFSSCSVIFFCHFHPLQASPFAQCQRKEAQMQAKILSAKSLKVANFEGTNLDEAGLEIILHDFKNLHSLSVDDSLW